MGAQGGNFLLPRGPKWLFLVTQREKFPNFPLFPTGSVPTPPHTHKNGRILGFSRKFGGFFCWWRGFFNGFFFSLTFPPFFVDQKYKITINGGRKKRNKEKLGGRGVENERNVEKNYGKCGEKK